MIQKPEKETIQEVIHDFVESRKGKELKKVEATKDIQDELDGMCQADPEIQKKKYNVEIHVDDYYAENLHCGDKVNKSDLIDETNPIDLTEEKEVQAIQETLDNVCKDDISLKKENQDLSIVSDKYKVDYVHCGDTIQKDDLILNSNDR